ncbi:MAG: hypothetical protein EOP20_02860 [Hyphomicrobiales bacterium]|nr:MAG: hypothetical protein EOP20_02860 [Hyphomicrobiales bacterium]
MKKTLAIVATLLFSVYSQASETGRFSKVFASSSTALIETLGQEASFSGSFYNDGSSDSGQLVLVNELDAKGVSQLQGKIAVMEVSHRIPFLLTFQLLQSYGAIAVVMINVDDQLFEMQGEALAATIPGLLITHEAGAKIQQAMSQGPVSIKVAPAHMTEGN